YQGYADYQDLMDLTEDMLRTLARDVLDNTLVRNTVPGADGEAQTVTYDFGKPFRRLTVFDAILEYNPDIDAAELADEQGARRLAEGLEIPLKDGWGLGKVQIEIFEKTAEH